MNILKKKNTAIVCMILMIILSMVIGSNISLRKLTASAEHLFYEGEDEKGNGIGTMILENADIGTNMLTIAARNSTSGLENDIAAVETQVSKVQDDKSPASLYEENLILTDAVTNLYNQLIQSGALPDDDNNYCIKLYTELNTNNKRIDKDSYHEEAASVNKDLKTFPANVFRTITGVNAVDEFVGRSAYEE